jgi:hypothetical protein
MKNNTNIEKKSEKTANENNSKEALKGLLENRCIIDMESYHKLNGIKINIKKFDDEFCEITIKKEKKNHNKKTKTDESNP